MSIPNFSVAGKVVIITGSSGGIGGRLATGFGEAGASVVGVDIAIAGSEAIAKDVRARGGKALAIQTDVTDDVQVSALVQRTVKEFGRIDALINCVGEGAFVPLLDVSAEEWDKVIARNLKSAYVCCRAVGKVMVGQKSGSIINFTSGTATSVIPGQTSYSAAKAGVSQLTRVLAAEWGRFNIRVNAISPGLTDTRLTRDSFAQDPGRLEKMLKAVPMGRMGQPQDILGAAIFLVSEASAFISGVIIQVAGGPQ